MDRSIRIITSIEIFRPPQQVWPHLVDWENLGKWMKEGRDFRVTSPQREGIGVTASAVISIAGLSTRDSIRVVQWDPPRVLGIEHLGWVSGSGRMECHGRGEHTLLRWEERLDPPLGLLGAAGIRLLQPLMRRIFLRDLRLLKVLVESVG